MPCQARRAITRRGPVAVNPPGAIACTIANTTLTCTTTAIYTLAAGASFSLTFQVTPAAAGNLANTAVARSGWDHAGEQ